MIKSVNPNIQRLLKPVLAFLVLPLLFSISFRIGLSKIQDQDAEAERLNKSIKILKDKEEILSKVESTVSSKGQFFSRALPETNPTLIVFSQLKSSTASLGLIMQNLKASSEVKDKNVSKVELSFDLAGGLPQILAFLNNIRNLAPVMNISKVQLGQIGSMAQANIIISAYWSAFPKKISAVGDPVSDLTKEETAAIDKITKLVMPPFSVVAPEAASGRTNPF